jgi:hypothetical protein
MGNGLNLIEDETIDLSFGLVMGCHIRSTRQLGRSITDGCSRPRCPANGSVSKLEVIVKT